MGHISAAPVVMWNAPITFGRCSSSGEDDHHKTKALFPSVTHNLSSTNNALPRSSVRLSISSLAGRPDQTSRGKSDGRKDKWKVR